MPNIYRVISLGLAMSLFFAAPLLCVVPISTQLKEGESLAVKNEQPETVRVVWKSGAYATHRSARAAAWARTVHRSSKAGHELPLEEEKWTATPAVSTGDKADSWHDDQHQNWDSAEASGGIGGDRTGSRTSIYY